LISCQPGNNLLIVGFLGWTQDSVIRWTAKCSTSASSKDAQAACIWMVATSIHCLIQGCQQTWFTEN